MMSAFRTVAEGGRWEPLFSSGSLQPNVAHYHLSCLLYCAKALHLHSGSCSVLLTWISILDLSSVASLRRLKI